MLAVGDGPDDVVGWWGLCREDPIRAAVILHVNAAMPGSGSRKWLPCVGILLGHVDAVRDRTVMAWVCSNKSSYYYPCNKPTARR